MIECKYLPFDLPCFFKLFLLSICFHFFFQTFQNRFFLAFKKEFYILDIFKQDFLLFWSKFYLSVKFIYSFDLGLLIQEWKYSPNQLQSNPELASVRKRSVYFTVIFFI